ncbi:MAG: integrase family protein [Conexibacter sp.]|nr:integrase family protein [Conexibacter sp.]
MPRPATGEVVEKPSARGGTTFALRFRAYGRRRYVTLGTSAEGWTRQRAETELENVLADVRRGIWQPPQLEPVVEPEVTADPTFHEFASEWWAAKKLELGENTVAAYEAELTLHVLPFFARHRLSEITIREVDRYRQSKVAESERRRAAIAARRPLIDDRGRVLRPFSPSYINATIKRLAQVLEVAVEYDLLPRNPARGERRRLKASRPRPVHLDGVDQIVAMLDAATSLDASSARTRGRRALIATLVFGGLRVTEACELRWRDVDLASGRITVGRAKTDAGMREVDIRPALRDELLAYRAARPWVGMNDLVFTSQTGNARTKDNVRQRVILPVVKRADELLDERGQQPLPRGVTAHKLRHTFGSILVACGEDPTYVMGQLGHTDPEFTLRVYTHAMRRDGDERARLRALIDGAEWAPLGTNDENDGGEVDETSTRPARFELATSRSGGERSIH